MFRGSRKHILDWTDQPDFSVELLKLIAPVDAKITAKSLWMPGGHNAPMEARLETFGFRAIPDEKVWKKLSEWWHCHPEGANTPNWDLALGAEIEGKPGLILVEAKANVPELSTAGKKLDRNLSRRSQDSQIKSKDNHERIGEAIEEACTNLGVAYPGIRIRRDSHYQLSNRVAFLWRLASLGIPTVLVYLGFYGDVGIADVGEPFRDLAHWKRAFADYARPVLPEEFLERRIQIGEAPAWLLVRAKQVIEPSKEGVASRDRRS
jgi:hypothetical protein